MIHRVQLSGTEIGTCGTHCRTNWYTLRYQTSSSSSKGLLGPILTALSKRHVRRQVRRGGGGDSPGYGQVARSILGLVELRKS